MTSLPVSQLGFSLVSGDEIQRDREHRVSPCTLSVSRIDRDVSRATPAPANGGQELRDGDETGHFESTPLVPVSELVRPRTRGECVAGPRPCPWASCRHHLAAELIRAGRIASDDQLPADVPTCSLDMADRGDSTLEEIGAIYGITREAVRIAAKKALARFTHRAIAGDVIDRVGWGVRGKNRADGTTADGPGEPEPDDEHEVEEEPEFLQRDFRPFLADDEELLLVDDRADSRADDAGPWSRSDTRVISVIDANDAGACGLVRRLYDRALEKSDASPNPTLTEVENKCTGG